MATLMWYPERGDPVLFRDGRTGHITDDAPILYDDEDSWRVVSTILGLAGKFDVIVAYSGITQQWEEQ